MPRPKANPDLPNIPGTKLLIALARHHALTATQAAILCFYSKKTPSRSYADEHLRRLVDHGYLIRQEPSEVGIEDVYLLADRGKRYLRDELGMEIDERTHHRPPKSLHLSHRLAVTSFLIQMERSGYPTLELYNEWQLSRMAAPIRLQNGKQVRYAPDAWFRMLVQEDEYPIALELDRATESAMQWQHKVQQMVAFTDVAEDGEYPFTKLFGVHRLRYAIVVTTGPVGTKSPQVRARNLLTWTELELERLGKEQWRTLFFIRPLDALQLDEQGRPIVDPQDILLGRSWCQPGSATYVPLIGGTA
jgi:hypothetical protein